MWRLEKKGGSGGWREVRRRKCVVIIPQNRRESQADYRQAMLSPTYLYPALDPAG